MVSDTVKTKLADTAAGTSLGGLFLSHIAQINEVMQFILLGVSIVSGLAATWYYLKKSSK